jgi:RHS repeat-associated protein
LLVLGRGRRSTGRHLPRPARRPQQRRPPTYSSEGQLHSLARTPTSGGTTTEHHVFYLSGNPVATLDKDGALRSFTYLLTDHLGTPILASDATGTVAWEGGFEPFGRDWKEGTGQGAHENGVFLRLPGQWFDEVWQDASSLVDPYYNVHRWYSPGIGRYTRPDPLGLRGDLHPYDYARADPLRWVDRLGLQSTPPPPSTRDPFSPPIDPSFPSGPWGVRPDPNCCDEEEIDKAIEGVDRQLRTLASGGVPSGTIGGSVARGHFCQADGWCQPEGPSPSIPFNPFISPDTKDPCVVFCVRVHEWYHYTDTRWWWRRWDASTYHSFTEGPAYGLEKACLRSFSGS